LFEECPEVAATGIPVSMLQKGQENSFGAPSRGVSLRPGQTAVHWPDTSPPTRIL
jgi:hypothetical protein